MALLEKILWQIESNLQRPLSLKELASLCCISPFHLSRLFRLATAFTPMSYLRARRLSVAATAIASQHKDIVDIALAMQYSSHETFTRAFSNYFGISLSKLRVLASTQTLSLMEPLTMQKDHLIKIDKPRIEALSSLQIMGLSMFCTPEKTVQIPDLWQRFNEREKEISATIGDVYYGVCHGLDETGCFNYLAGIQVTATTNIPQAMTLLTIPDNQYAVFSHVGHVAELPKTIYSIWNNELSKLGLQPEEAPDFERYDINFNPQTGQGIIELWIPIL